MPEPTMLPELNTQVTIDGQLVTVLSATPTVAGANLVFRRSDGSLDEASLEAADLARAHAPCLWFSGGSRSGRQLPATPGSVAPIAATRPACASLVTS